MVSGPSGGERQPLLFDANCFLGDWGPTQPGACRDAAGLLRAMDYAGIDEALVYQAAAVHYEPRAGNGMLARETKGQARLHPCRVVMPHHTGEMPEPRAIVDEMRQQGVRAARLYPKRIGPLRAFVYGPLLRALSEFSVPTLVDFEGGHQSQHLQAIDWDGLDWALGEYRELPLVLVRVGQQVDRTLIPFMERHDNLYLETSYYIGTGALERICDLFGPGRLLFGTGMPRYAPGPAITLLSYSGLDEEARRAVGGGNLRRLLGRTEGS